MREIVVRTMTLTPSSNRVAARQSARAARLVAFARFIRARARLISALVLLSFVLCHLVSHISLIVSLPVAEQVLDRLMRFWRTETGTYVLATALAVHILNAVMSRSKRQLESANGMVRPCSRSAWPRRSADAHEIRSHVQERTEERLLRCGGDRRGHHEVRCHQERRSA